MEFSILQYDLKTKTGAFVNCHILYLKVNSIFKTSCVTTETAENENKETF